MNQPIQCTWDGEAFIPATKYQAKLADRQFVVGERYAITEYSERSDQSHRHFFALLHDLWMNLPEHLAPQFPNPEVLRAHALIRCGYADKTSFVCRSAGEAQRFAAFLGAADGHSIIEVDAATITRWTAQSQAYRAMGKQPASPSAERWQDISTAPKEHGARFLTWNADVGPVVCDRYGELIVLAWNQTHYNRATHWMALPSPPGTPSTPTHRHKARGTTVTLVGMGKIEAKGRPGGYAGNFAFVKDCEVATLRAADGSLVTVPKEEFETQYEGVK